MTGHPLDNAVSGAAFADPVQKLVAEAAVQLASQQVVNDMSFRLDELESTMRDVVPAYGTDGGSGGGGSIPSVYEIGVTSTTPERKHFINRYYEVSGVIHEGPDISGSLESYADKFVAIRIKANGSTEIATYSSFSQMQGDMVDQTKVVMPLYKLDANGDVAVDFRHLPRADMWSLGLAGSAAS